MFTIEQSILKRLFIIGCLFLTSCSVSPRPKLLLPPDPVMERVIVQRGIIQNTSAVIRNHTKLWKYIEQVKSQSNL